MNAGDVIINAIGGAAIGLAGTFVINLIRSTRLLDADRAAEIETLCGRESSLAGELKAAREQIAGPPMSPIERDRLELVTRHLNGFSEEERGVIRYILQYGSAHSIRLAEEFGDVISESATAKALTSSLITAWASR